MDSDLRALLAAFDGVHSDTLEEIAATLPSDPQILNALCNLALSEERNLQSASTWLLKRFAERGITLGDAQSTALLAVLLGESHWEATLHVLQMLGELRIPADKVAALWARLTEQTGQRQRLIRAWSYHGIAVIAGQHPACRVEAGRWLDQGERDEAASVRARIRRLRKSFEWLR